MNTNTDKSQLAKTQLAKIEKLLARTVGVQKIQRMTIDEFVAHAGQEVTKASKEPIEKSRVRLSLLYKSTIYASTAIEDADSDSVKVPVFVVDQTTFGEQSNEIMPPSKVISNGTGGGDGSYASNIAKGFEMFKSTVEDLIDRLTKLDKAKFKGPPGDEDEGEDEGEDEKADKDDDEEGETEKAKGKGKDEDEDAEKKKPPFPGAKPFPPGKGGDEKDEKKKGKKTGKADARWPGDMNDSQFVEKGEPTEPTWGKDA
jgi:hypothetical protein